MELTFQWGHDFSAMDTSGEMYRTRISNGFNGAMTFQPWILSTEDGKSNKGNVSMGHDFLAMDTVFS